MRASSLVSRIVKYSDWIALTCRIFNYLFQSIAGINDESPVPFDKDVDIRSLAFNRCLSLQDLIYSDRCGVKLISRLIRCVENFRMADVPYLDPSVKGDQQMRTDRVRAARSSRCVFPDSEASLPPRLCQVVVSFHRSHHHTTHTNCRPCRSGGSAQYTDLATGRRQQAS